MEEYIINSITEKCLSEEGQGGNKYNLFRVLHLCLHDFVCSIMIGHDITCVST